MVKDSSVASVEIKTEGAASVTAIERIESQINELTSTVTYLATKMKKLSSLAPPIPFIKSYLKTEFPAADDYERDDDGNSSVVSHTSDVQFISKMLHPTFVNKDAITKQDQDRLKQVQDKFLSKIPMLQYSGENQRTHNYSKWLKALLKYFSVLSPVLAETTKNFLSSIDIDEFVQNDNPNSLVTPKIEESSYPDLMKLLAYSAVTNSLSLEFEALIEDNTMTNIFPMLAIIHCFCQPNSSDDRTDAQAAFWLLRMVLNENIFQFGRRVREQGEIVNSQSSSTVISDDQMIACLKIGVKHGAQSDKFTQPLSTLRLLHKKLNFQSTLTWLHNQSRTYEDTKVAHSSSMARTRGGKGGGTRGGGRGGKARKGAKGAKGNPTDSRTNNYYVATDDDGDEVITKEIKEKKLGQPCFNHIQLRNEGGCTRSSCPYDHNFNIVDTKPSNKKVSFDDDKKNGSSNASTSQKFSNNHATHEEEEVDGSDESDFNYATDMGYTHHTSSVSATCGVQPQVPIPEILLTTSNFTGSTFFSAKLWLPILLATSFLFCMAGKILSWSSSLYRQSFILFCSLLFLPINAFFRVCKFFMSLLGRSPCHCVSAAAIKALYPVILDCGCTFTMSGDVDLFIPSSLSPISHAVGLAQSGKSVAATHYGKMNVGGRLIDALLVPAFKQTMISMGQLEKMGLTYSATGNNRNFMTPSNSIFLSFSLATNNLYELNISTNAIHTSANANDCDQHEKL